MISLDAVKRHNPLVGADLRRVFENIDLINSFAIDEAAPSQSNLLPNPLAHLDESTGAVGAGAIGYLDEGGVQAGDEAEAGDNGSDPNPDSDQETVSDDGSENDNRDEVLMFCDTYIAPTAASDASLQTTVPLPLSGTATRIKYRKNLAKAQVLLARLTGKSKPLISDFRYPLPGHFYILVEENGGAATHRFLRVYGEFTSENSVGHFVLPREVVRIIERELDMLPKESVTFTAAAAGLDPGPGYKFNALPGHFALTVVKS